MIRLYGTESDALLGSITEVQLEFLMNELEEESSSDRDYFITTETVDMLEGNGADPALLTLLREALTDREEMEIRWEAD